MSEEHDRRSVELSGDELKAVSVENLRGLHQKYGLEVSIRSTRKAIDEILKEIGRDDFGLAADFTRGFDRTSGGYNRYYDRDIAIFEQFEDVINPGIERG